jgi:hypothetical protein
VERSRQVAACNSGPAVKYASLSGQCHSSAPDARTRFTSWVAWDCFASPGGFRAPPGSNRSRSSRHPLPAQLLCWHPAATAPFAHRTT